jgi:hypothetical protein
MLQIELMNSVRNGGVAGIDRAAQLSRTCRRTRSRKGIIRRDNSLSRYR